MQMKHLANHKKIFFFFAGHKLHFLGFFNTLRVRINRKAKLTPPKKYSNYFQIDTRMITVINNNNKMATIISGVILKYKTIASSAIQQYSYFKENDDTY